MLSENGELTLKNKEIANTFNDHFGSFVNNLSLDHWMIIPCHRQKVLIGLIISSNGIKTPSIKNIRAKFNRVRSFSFQPGFMDEIYAMAVIRDMKNNKSVGGKIPTQILKESEFTFEILIA